MLHIHVPYLTLPYLLLPTYMPDKPDIYLLQGTTLMPKQPNCIPTLPYLTLGS